MQGLRSFMYGKIHRVRVTECNLDYIGSITIDPVLLSAAGIYPNTLVDVVNVTNGNRIQTYVIEGRPGSGDICVNGAAAHQFQAEDLAIIMGYEFVQEAELTGRISRAVMVDAHNVIQEVRTFETPSLQSLGQPQNNRYADPYPYSDNEA